MADIAAPTPEESLKRPLESETEPNCPPQTVLLEESAVTKAEKAESNGSHYGTVKNEEPFEAPAAKRVKIEQSEAPADQNEPRSSENKVDARDKVKGVALVKPE